MATVLNESGGWGSPNASKGMEKRSYRHRAVESWPERWQSLSGNNALFLFFLFFIFVLFDHAFLNHISRGKNVYS